ncbi:MAG: rhodanese-like domain-containing protein [Methylococcales bacterium]|nr:rhodanese-like domain-containing protein [Methylococcales bacterium]
MMFKSAIFLLLSAFSCWLGATELGQVSAEQLQAMQQNRHALVVDIRTAAEWQASGVIPGSHTLQAYGGDGSFNAEKWLADLHKLKSSPDQPVILVCRSGNRSGKLGEFLIRQGERQIYHLGDGMQSWIKSGYPVDSNNTPNNKH